jgi:hypothetical protein
VEGALENRERVCYQRASDKFRFVYRLTSPWAWLVNARESELLLLSMPRALAFNPDSAAEIQLFLPTWFWA